jgi:uncharacterized protein
MANTDTKHTYRALCIDGGGMRGIYSAAYLNALNSGYCRKRDITRIDLGKAFNLICGTSTGAILACALANDVDLERVVKLYRDKGQAIFPEKVPGSLLKLALQWPHRRLLNMTGAKALEAALTEELQGTTIGDVWKKRKIALALPAVEMSRHRAWVFKTAHLANSKDRDGNYTLVQACMASTAAPVFRSMAWLPAPDGQSNMAFVDGGLWANNPVLVGLIDALGMTEPGDAIELFCLGTCPPPSGDQVASEEQTHRGYAEWRVGADVANVAIAAQQYAYDNMALMIGRHTGRNVHVIRFPKGAPAASLMEHLDLDETRPVSMNALIRQGQTDAYEAMSVAGRRDDKDGNAIDRLFLSAPASKDKEE